MSERECSFRAKESVLSYHYTSSHEEYREGLLRLAGNIDRATVVLADIFSLEGVLQGPVGGVITVNMTDYGTTFTSDFDKIRNALIRELDLKSIHYMKADNVPKRKYISLHKYIVRRAPNNHAELTYPEPTDIVIFGSEIFITSIDWVPSNYGMNMPFPHITEDANARARGTIVHADIIDLGTGKVIDHLSTGTDTLSVAALSDVMRAFPDASTKSFIGCAIICGFTGAVRATHGDVDGELIIIGNGNINFKTKVTRGIVV